MSRFEFVQKFLARVRPEYTFLFATYDYGKNLDSYFLRSEHAVYMSKPGEGPNESVMLDQLEEHEIAQKIVWMIESSNSW